MLIIKTYHCTHRCRHVKAGLRHPSVMCHKLFQNIALYYNNWIKHKILCIYASIYVQTLDYYLLYISPIVVFLDVFQACSTSRILNSVGFSLINYGLSFYWLNSFVSVSSKIEKKKKIGELYSHNRCGFDSCRLLKHLVSMLSAGIELTTVYTYYYT